MAIVGEAHVIVRAITTGFQKDIDDAMNGITNKAQAAGVSLGSAFSSGASGGLSKLDQQALNTYKSINRLIEGGYYLQGAIAGLLPVVADLVGGLFALGAQAAAAAPALIVLPSVFSAIGQAAITAKLAFSGVSKAIGALSKKSKGGGGIDKLPGLLEKYANAQERAKNANTRVKKSYEALTEAQEAARESLQQLNFDAEDAAIAEQKASIELAKARETLLRVQDLPPNSAARKEAELAYAEADLNLRRAKDRNADLAKETETRNAAGVEGSKEVLNALEDITEAEKAQKKAIIEKAKAKKELDNAKAGKGGGGGGGDGADATAGLSKEAASFAKYIADLKPKLDELKASAGKDLFPALETAVGNLVTNLFPTLNKILGDTGKALGQSAIDFSKVVTEADNLKNLNTVAGTNKDTIGKLGKVAGNLYSVFLSLLSAADPLIRRFTDWLVVLTSGLKTTTEAKNKTGELTNTFNKAGDVVAQLGRILRTLGSAFMDMGKAATGPGSGGQLILDYFEKAAKKFKDFTSAGLKDGSLKEYFKNVATNFTKVLDILGKITGAFAKVGGKKSTGSFLDSIGKSIDILAPALEKLTDGGAGGAFGKFIEQIAEFLAATSDSGSIKVYFTILTTALGLLNSILTNPITSKILAIVAAVHGGRLAFSRFGKTINTAKDYIKGSIDSFKDMYDKTSNVRDGFKYARTQGDGFFGSIKAGIKNSKSFQKVFGQNSKVLSTYQSATNKAKTAFTALKDGAIKAKGMVMGLGKAIKSSTLFTKLSSAATKAWTAVQAAFNAVMAMNPIVLIVVAIVALIAIVVAAYFKFQWFRDFVDSVWDKIAAGLSFLWQNIIKPIFEAIGSVFGAVWGVIKVVFGAVWGAIKTSIEFVWNNIIKPIFEAIGSVFGAIWGAIKGAFDFVWGSVQAQISFSWNKIIKPIFEAFGAVFGAVWGVIKGAFDLVWGAIKTSIDFAWNRVIKPVFEAIGSVFGKIWDGIKGAFTRVWDFITGAIDKAKDIFSGITDAIKGAFKTAFNFVANIWNKTIGKIGFKAPSWLGGWEFNVPDIPLMAKGGVVSPRTGGTLAVIGEGGRPERVEPLDTDGLSQRDRAIITLLSGGRNTGGVNITVNPSPGMDEVELAALVSRQISFQLRRGAA
jgi:phage-related protein